ncbi:uncharacterized protein LOC129751196 [Uranotaenia lowii]|uniref:uncharacterized protein LOC129751196 n=1 Tax=Uranotaenia lowii TaxID=190385 RepID=UPI0024784C3D|nr:uncharacterized protein LOC129751196 [Uranotaenia lowii]
MSNFVPIHSVQNAIEQVADPVHTPITIGHEPFLLTQQDQRSILDRRSWFLSKLPVSSPECIWHFLCQLNPCLLEQLIQWIMHQQFPQYPPVKSIENMPALNFPCEPRVVPYQFHYEKQTSTEDLPWYQRGNKCLEMIGDQSVMERAIKHVHYVIHQREFSNRDVQTMDRATFIGVGEPMECDPAEVQPPLAESALDRIRQQKEQVSWFY